MKNFTRGKISNWIANVAKAYGASPATVQAAKQFAATPSVEQTLKKALAAKSDLLSKINTRMVTQIKGAKLGLSAVSQIASRTDTSGAGVRVPKKIQGIDDDQYECKKTNFDVAIPYELLDEWAEFKNFMQLLQDLINETIANNKVMIGWYGESHADTTDLASNPLLQDVNIGWFQKIRDNAASQMLSEGSVAGQIRIGAGGDYVNLDHLVEDIKQGIPAHKRKDPNMKVIIGDELLSSQRVALYKTQGSQPTEKERIETKAVTSEFGSLPAVQDAMFPERGLMITSYKNLGHYTQKGSLRRTIKDHAEKDQYENFMSMNDAYVVEDYEALACIEFKNVLLPDGAGGWQ